jgi:N5-(cytidine 5'-diphosphoramidyl)-L-glutamine hydrolase
MKMLAITQRVAVDPHGERRDCLAQDWASFLGACGLAPLPLPNMAEVALAICRAVPLAGIVLSGGDDLAAYGGFAPERDATESALIGFAEEHGLPLLGVCRGMQAIQHRFGVTLSRVSAHVTKAQKIRVGGGWATVNSYHNWGAHETREPLVIWATAEDGIIEAVRHKTLPMVGIMWHPERLRPYARSDISLFTKLFSEA